MKRTPTFWVCELHVFLSAKKLNKSHLTPPTRSRLGDANAVRSYTLSVRRERPVRVEDTRSRETAGTPAEHTQALRGTELSFYEAHCRGPFARPDCGQHRITQ
jgi:hypothetical protein